MDKPPINRLSAGLQFKLMNYVKDHYTSSGLYDPEFAKQAEQTLQFPITAGNIKGCREALEIKPNFVNHATKASEMERMQQGMVSLALRVQELESQVAQLMRERGQRGVK